MKTRNLYLLIVIFIFIIFILIYSNSKVVQLQQPELKEAQMENQALPEAISQSAEFPPLARQAITVVKQAEKRVKAPPEINQAEEIIIAQNPVSSANEANNSVSGQSSSSTADQEAAAGITRLGKYPTAEKIKEMNAKGIIIY